MNRHPCSPIGFVLLLAACMGIGGCSRQGKQGAEAPAPTVSVSYPLQREVTDHADYTGRTAAVDSVQVRARVSGYLQKINFTEGAEVKQDDVLYEIDPRPYQFALNQAQAQVRLQEANLKYQEAVYNRNLKLFTSGQAVSQEELQQSLAQRDTTRAAVNAAEAAVKTAELNLSFTKVTAPVSGRISRTLVTRGNLVVADQTILTSIVSLDPIYAYFDVDEPTVLHVQQLIREGKFKSAREQGTRVPVFLGLATEDGFPHEGSVDFINNQVTASTGTLQVRAIFPNPKPPVGARVLAPGLFARIRVSIGPPYQALLVNQRVIGTDQNLRFVYIVDDQNEVVRRQVQLGPQQGPLQVIADGLTAKDRVVVNALQRVRMGLVVEPRLVEMPVESVPTQQPATPPGQNAPSKQRPQVAPNMQQNPGSGATKP